MRVKIGKQSRKTIQYYRINYHFREPYKVVVDGNFFKVCIDKKMEIKSKMEKVLGGKCLLATTPCILRELQQLGENFRGIFIAARRFPKENCKHEGNVEPNECLKALVGDTNDGKVIIASQDYELIQQLRNIPGSFKVPTVQILHGKMTIHEPAEEVKENLDKELKERGNVTEREKQILKPVIKKMKEEEKQRAREKIKKQKDKIGLKQKKKAKGPNPMSMRKKFKSVPGNDQQ